MQTFARARVYIIFYEIEAVIYFFCIFASLIIKNQLETG